MSDVIEPGSAGRVEPRELELEMRSSFLDYAMSVIVSRALPDVRDGLKPVHRRVLWGMHDAGMQPNRPYKKSRRDRRRRDGELPPARRPGDLRHARAHGAAVLAALPARRRPGQLRLARRRPAGRDALHGVPARRSSRPRCCATSTWTRSTSGRTTTSRARSRSRCRRGSRTCSSTARPGSPSGWRRTCRRTTSARSIDAVVQLIDKPDANVDDLMKHVKGPDFPTGAIIVGRSGHPRRLPHGPRPHRHARPRPHRGAARRQERDRRHRAARTASRRAATSGVIKKIADLVNEKVITEVSDLADHSDRSGMRIQIELKRDAIPQVALNKLFKHTAAAVDVRLQRRRARRRRAARDVAARAWCATTSTSSARSSRGARSSSCARTRSARTSSRAT